MNMLREVYLYELDTETNELVRVTPSSTEAANGRRMAATLQLLARDFAKSGREAVMDTSLGEIRYKENLRRKTREAVITLYVGAFSYKELRRWICLGLQYLTGEFPTLVFDMDRKECRVRFDSNCSIALDHAR